MEAGCLGVNPSFRFISWLYNFPVPLFLYLWKGGDPSLPQNAAVRINSWNYIGTYDSLVHSIWWVLATIEIIIFYDHLLFLYKNINTLSSQLICILNVINAHVRKTQYWTWSGADTFLAVQGSQSWYLEYRASPQNTEQVRIAQSPTRLT